MQQQIITNSSDGDQRYVHHPEVVGQSEPRRPHTTKAVASGISRGDLARAAIEVYLFLAKMVCE